MADHVIEARTGLRFVAGRLEFSFTAMPPELVLLLRMFDAAKLGNMEELKLLVEAGKSTKVTLPYFNPAQYVEEGMYQVGGARRLSVVSVVTTQGVDINTEYHAPSYDDEGVFTLQAFTRRKSSAWRRGGDGGGASLPMSPSSPVDVNGWSPSEARLLLHVAIQRNHVEMVKFLLDQGADVSWGHGLEGCGLVESYASLAEPLLRPVS